MTNAHTALVTGASSGIGEGLAKALAAQGNHVVLVARSGDKLEVLAEALRSQGGKASVIACDLAQPGAAAGLVQTLSAQNLTIDTLVNNAGLGIFGGFETHTPERLYAMMQVNMLALTELSFLLMPTLLTRRGRILNIASTAGFMPAPNMAVYAASKAYVVSLSEALWAEYRTRGLHIACVCPGPVETPFIDAMGSAARSTSVFQSFASVEDVVAVCMQALEGSASTYRVGFRAWLLSNVSRFATREMVARIAASKLTPTKY